MSSERSGRRGCWVALTLFRCAALVVCTCVDAVAVEYHVNPAHPESRDGGSGSAAQPFKTLSHAVQRLTHGDRLVIASGTYRETIDLRSAQLTRETQTQASAAQRTIIEAAPGADVVIKGSDVVSGWEHLGDGVHVKRGWSVNTQQVFVDGVALQQIGGSIFGGYPGKQDHPMADFHRSQGGIWPGRLAGSAKTLPEASFYYDETTQALYIKRSRAALPWRQVEVSVRPFLVIGQDLARVSMRNLRFSHANTSAVWHTGAIALNGNHLELDRIEVTQVDAAGIDIAGDDNVIKNSTTNYCGQLGMKAKGKRVRLLGNETSHNNTRGFNKWWEAGGAKFVGEGGLQDSEVADHRAYANNGDGIWFDWRNRNNRVHGAVSAYNSGFGIHYEASEAGYIFNNYVFANAQRGIYLPHSSRCIVAHNLVAHNGLEAIVVIDEQRRDQKGEVDLTPRGNQIIGNVIAWNAQPAIILPAARGDNVSNYNLVLSAAEEPTFALGWPSVLNRARTGLQAWRRFSEQDQASRASVHPVPAQIADALRARAAVVDWVQPLTLASAITIPDAARPHSPAVPASMFREHPGPHAR